MLLIWGLLSSTNPTLRMRKCYDTQYADPKHYLFLGIFHIKTWVNMFELFYNNIISKYLGLTLS